MKGIARLFVHTVTVETFTGVSGYGVETFAAPVVLAPPNGALVENARRMVRNKDGDEVVSETTIYTSLNNASLFNTDARVTINNVVSRVIKVNSNDAPGLRLPEHLAVTLQ